MSEKDLKVIKDAIRDIPDFPKPGIIFLIFQNRELSLKISRLC